MNLLSDETLLLWKAHLVVAGHIGDSPVLPRQVVLELVDAVVLAVDGADQHVVGDVVQVTAELEPGPCGADVVGGALPLHLQGQEAAWVRSGGGEHLSGRRRLDSP